MRYGSLKCVEGLCSAIDSNRKEVVMSKGKMRYRLVFGKQNEVEREMNELGAEGWIVSWPPMMAWSYTEAHMFFSVVMSFFEPAPVGIGTPEEAA